MKEIRELSNVKIETAPREYLGKTLVNLYIYIDGKRFELVPHCRSKRETAYFYNMLARSELSLPDK